MQESSCRSDQLGDFMITTPCITSCSCCSYTADGVNPIDIDPQGKFNNLEQFGYTAFEVELNESQIKSEDIFTQPALTQFLSILNIKDNFISEASQQINANKQSGLETILAINTIFRNYLVDQGPRANIVFHLGNVYLVKKTYNFSLANTEKPCLNPNKYIYSAKKQESQKQKYQYNKSKYKQEVDILIRNILSPSVFSSLINFLYEHRKPMNNVSLNDSQGPQAYTKTWAIRLINTLPALLPFPPPPLPLLQPSSNLLLHFLRLHTLGLIEGIAYQLPILNETIGSLILKITYNRLVSCASSLNLQDIIDLSRLPESSRKIILQSTLRVATLLDLVKSQEPASRLAFQFLVICNYKFFRIDLRNLDLNGIDLSTCTMVKCDLNGTNFQNCLFSKTSAILHCNTNNIQQSEHFFPNPIPDSKLIFRNSNLKSFAYFQEDSIVQQIDLDTNERKDVGIVQGRLVGVLDQNVLLDDRNGQIFLVGHQGRAISILRKGNHIWKNDQEVGIFRKDGANDKLYWFHIREGRKQEFIIKETYHLKLPLACFGKSANVLSKIQQKSKEQKPIEKKPVDKPQKPKNRKAKHVEELKVQIEKPAQIPKLIQEHASEIKILHCPTIYFYDSDRKNVMIWNPPNHPQLLFSCSECPYFLAYSLGFLIIFLGKTITIWSPEITLHCQFSYSISPISEAYLISPNILICLSSIQTKPYSNSTLIFRVINLKERKIVKHIVLEPGHLIYWWVTLSMKFVYMAMDSLWNVDWQDGDIPQRQLKLLTQGQQSQAEAQLKQERIFTDQFLRFVDLSPFLKAAVTNDSLTLLFPNQRMVTVPVGYDLKEYLPQKPRLITNGSMVCILSSCEASFYSLDSASELSLSPPRPAIISSNIFSYYGGGVLVFKDVCLFKENIALLEVQSRWVKKNCLRVQLSPIRVLDNINKTISRSFKCADKVINCSYEGLFILNQEGRRIKYYTGGFGNGVQIEFDQEIGIAEIKHKGIKLAILLQGRPFGAMGTVWEEIQTIDNLLVARIGKTFWIGNTDGVNWVPELQIKPILKWELIRQNQKNFIFVIREKTQQEKTSANKQFSGPTLTIYSIDVDRITPSYEFDLPSDFPIVPASCLKLTRKFVAFWNLQRQVFGLFLQTGKHFSFTHSCNIKLILQSNKTLVFLDHTSQIFSLDPQTLKASRLTNLPRSLLIFYNASDEGLHFTNGSGKVYSFEINKQSISEISIPDEHLLTGILATNQTIFLQYGGIIVARKGEQIVDVFRGTGKLLSDGVGGAYLYVVEEDRLDEEMIFKEEDYKVECYSRLYPLSTSQKICRNAVRMIKHTIPSTEAEIIELQKTAITYPFMDYVGK